MFDGLSAHSFATITNFQWFSKLPSPLNGMVEGNHWDQWFSDGFGVRRPLVTMVFNGCAPLVRRWNGYVPSSKSTRLQQLHSGISRPRPFVDSTWSVALLHLNVFSFNHQTAKTSAIWTFKAGDVWVIKWMTNSNWTSFVTHCYNFWCWKWFFFMKC